ncbi:MAG: beta-lactamase family protein [Gammaproteobacteria bacterium]|nr:beta-lactamase family protein [Gammaproteobacteria bacterium]
MRSTTATDWPIAGDCDRKFRGVRDAFLANFSTDGDCGAAVCLMLDGQPVVDLWGGYLDLAHTIPWQRETLVNAYSVGKGVVSMLALDSIGRGELDLIGPLAAVWPELAAAGKGKLSMQMLLSHRAGLPAVRELLPAAAKYDWKRVCAALAAQAPFWEPDSTHGYHTNTFGFLVGEVVARAAGRPLRQLLQERLTGPQGCTFYWGVPRRLQSRIAPMLLQDDISIREQQRQAGSQPADDAIDAAALRWRCYFNPPGISGFGAVNTRAWRSAAIPSTNGHTHARGLAELYAGFVARSSRELLADATRPHSDGLDYVLQRPSRFGLGFQLNHPKQSMGPATSAFGHFGYGGSLGMADPERGLAFAYVTNRPAPRFHVARTSRLLDTIYACL